MVPRVISLIERRSFGAEEMADSPFVYLIKLFILLTFTAPTPLCGTALFDSLRKRVPVAESRIAVETTQAGRQHWFICTQNRPIIIQTHVCNLRPCRLLLTSLHLHREQQTQRQTGMRRITNTTFWHDNFFFEPISDNDSAGSKCVFSLSLDLKFVKTATRTAFLHVFSVPPPPFFPPHILCCVS